MNLDYLIQKLECSFYKEIQTKTEEKYRNVLNSLTMPKGAIGSKGREIDSNIPIQISSPTIYYPFFHTILFLGHQLHPPALLAPPLDFNRTPGSSRAGSRSLTAVWVMTCFSCLHHNRTSEMHGNQTLECCQTPGIYANESCSSVAVLCN